ncbi:MAG: sialidase family protein [Actinomycetota bacterium]
MALDDANHLYFVDTEVADNTITRWTISGRDRIKLDYSRPLIPSAQLVDYRPWITAHGDGEVFYTGNTGVAQAYPAGGGSGSGVGPGRFIVYASHDGGQTFDSVGVPLKDSGWCRPAADHARGSTYIYVICTDDKFLGLNNPTGSPDEVGNVYAYVSPDNGATFERYKMGEYKPRDSTTTYPTVAIAPDGSIWALYVDAARIEETKDELGESSFKTISNKLMLYHSRDHGKTWSRQDITPASGRYRYSWLALSQDGKTLGLGVYRRPGAKAAWQVFGAAWKPGRKPALTALDPGSPVAPSTGEPPGDLLGAYFDPDARLSVVWTRPVLRSPTGSTIYRDIYHARSLPVSAVLGLRRTRPAPPRATTGLPATGLSDDPESAVLAFVVASAVAAFVSRRRA